MAKQKVQRKMVIQRVRNPQDETQFVDIAITTGIVVERGQGQDYQRTAWTFQVFQLGKDEDMSDEFTVEKQDDLIAAANSFAASHPD